MKTVKLTILLSLFLYSSSPVFCTNETKSPTRQLYDIASKGPFNISPNDVQKASSLIAKGANVNYIHYEWDIHQLPQRQFTPLYHKVIRSGNLDLLKLLVEHGLRVNVKDCYGQTGIHITFALHLAYQPHVTPHQLHLGGGPQAS